MRAVSSILLSLVVVCPSSAQRLAPSLPGAMSAWRSTPDVRWAPATTQPKAQSKSPAGAIVGSVLGVTAGTFVAGTAWYMACFEGCGEQAPGLIALGLAGEALLASFGTHLGNRFAGNFLLDLAVAGGIAAAAGGATAAASDAADGAILLSAAVVQVVALVLVERAKGARRGQTVANRSR